MAILILVLLNIHEMLDGHVDHILEGLVEVVADPGEAIKKKLIATILIDIFLAHISEVINWIWHLKHFQILYFLGLLRKVKRYLNNLCSSK